MAAFSRPFSHPNLKMCSPMRSSCMALPCDTPSASLESWAGLAPHKVTGLVLMR